MAEPVGSAASAAAADVDAADAGHVVDAVDAVSTAPASTEAPTPSSDSATDPSTKTPAAFTPAGDGDGDMHMSSSSAIPTTGVMVLDSLQPPHKKHKSSKGKHEKKMHKHKHKDKSRSPMDGSVGGKRTHKHKHRRRSSFSASNPALETTALTNATNSTPMLAVPSTSTTTATSRNEKHSKKSKKKEKKSKENKKSKKGDKKRRKHGKSPKKERRKHSPSSSSTATTAGADTATAGQNSNASGSMGLSSGTGTYLTSPLAGRKVRLKLAHRSENDDDVGGDDETYAADNGGSGAQAGSERKRKREPTQVQILSTGQPLLAISAATGNATVGIDVPTEPRATKEWAPAKIVVLVPGSHSLLVGRALARRPQAPIPSFIAYPRRTAGTTADLRLPVVGEKTNGCDRKASAEVEQDENWQFCSRCFLDARHPASRALVWTCMECKASYHNACLELPLLEGAAEPTSWKCEKCTPRHDETELAAVKETMHELGYSYATRHVDGITYTARNSIKKLDSGTGSSAGDAGAGLDDDDEDNDDVIGGQHGRMLFGMDAIAASRNSREWCVRRPFSRGRFNIDTNGMPTALQVVSDFFEAVVEHILGISEEDRGDYAVSLCVPSTWSPREVAWCTDILLRELGFGAVMPLQEPMCAVFGNAQPTACVVNLGHESVTVGCVDDGMLIPSSVTSGVFGGLDVARALLSLSRTQTKHHWPYPQCDPAVAADALILERMMQRCAHLSPDLKVDVFSFVAPAPQARSDSSGDGLARYSLNASDVLGEAPLGLFHPTLFGTQQSLRLHQLHWSVLAQSDPADVLWNESYFNESNNLTSLLQIGISGESTSASQPSAEKDRMLHDRAKEMAQHAAATAALQEAALSHGVHQLVIDSISRVNDPELQVELFANLLVLGGVARISGLPELLCDRISHELRSASGDIGGDAAGAALAAAQAAAAVRKRRPGRKRAVREDDVVAARAAVASGTVAVHVAALDPLKGGDDPRFVSWRGCAVASRLPAMQDIWIAIEEWEPPRSVVGSSRSGFTAAGVRILREKAPWFWES